MNETKLDDGRIVIHHKYKVGDTLIHPGGSHELKIIRVGCDYGTAGYETNNRLFRWVTAEWADSRCVLAPQVKAVFNIYVDASFAWCTSHDTREGADDYNGKGNSASLRRAVVTVFDNDVIQLERL